MEIKTERLVLKSPDMSSVKELHKVILESSPEMEVWLQWVSSNLELKSVSKNMLKAIESFKDVNKEKRFFIYDKKFNNLVGAIGVVPRNAYFFEFGYWLKTTAVGNGYISEDLIALEKFILLNNNVRRLQILAAEDNFKSRAVAERNGYKLDAILQNYSVITKGVVNVAMYSKCLD